MEEKPKSAQEVADILGLSKSRILKARKEYGVGFKLGNAFFFYNADIEVIRSRQGKTGRPPAEDS